MSLIQYLSKIQFDFGAIKLLANELDLLGLKRPLLVTDPGIEACGILEHVLEAAKPHVPTVYSKTTENPNERSLKECLEIWHTHNCDGLIALGGGSPIDLSKSIALLATHKGELADYDVKIGGSSRIGKVAPQIAIPTAAGTGAEIGRACVMTLNSGRKCVAVNLNMVANTVIADPELTLSLPKKFTAATGIDALSHTVEAYLSPSVNPPADAIALDGFVRNAHWLKKVIDNGSNREARWHMMMASLQGGMVLQKGLGAAHAMATPLGEKHYHHGTLIGILLPNVLEFNAPSVPIQINTLEKAAGLRTPIANWLRELVQDIGLPGKLSELGEKGNEISEIAKKAKADHLTLTNPRKMTIENYELLLRQSL